MNRQQRQRAATDVTLLAGQALADFGDWYAKLAEWAEVGYPTGSGAPASGGDTADPSFLAAVSTDKMRDARRDVDRLFKEFARITNRLSRYRGFVTLTVAPPSEERLVYCVNIACMERIAGEGSDVPRCGGRCQRCGKHWERYGADWPTKRVVGREAKRAS